MRGRRPSIFPVEGQSTPKAESVQVLDLTQLRLDPLQDLEAVDSLLRRRQPGSRPGQRRLLTERRDAMRALAAELRG
jgi:hypothetical protein